MAIRRIRRIGALQAAKISFFVYLAIGLCMLPFVALFSMFAPDAEGVGFGLGYALVLPIMYGGVGAIGSALICGLYNLIAKFTGGLEFDVEHAPIFGEQR